MTTTDMDIEAQIPWAKEIIEMDALKEAAIARGIDPDLAGYMAQTAALQKNVMRHNARAMGVEPLHYGSVEEFVLVHGQPMTPPDPKHPRPKGLRKGRDRMCFMNATRATIERGYRYVEGVGQHFIPTHHAWVVQPVPRSAIALVGTTPEHVLRQVAVGAKHAYVTATRLPEQSPVEVAVTVAFDTEARPVKGSITIDVIQSEELERILATARARPTVQSDDLLACISPLTGGLPPVGESVLIMMSDAVLRLLLPGVFATGGTPLEPIDGLLAATASAHGATDCSVWRASHVANRTMHTSSALTGRPWVLDEDDNVIETTWKDSGSAYAGVEFPEHIMRDAIYLTGVYGVFGQTLLEEPYDPEHPEAFIERLKAKPKKDR